MATKASSSHFLLACKNCIQLPAAKSSNRWANLFLRTLPLPCGRRCNRCFGNNMNSRHPRSDLLGTGICCFFHRESHGIFVRPSQEMEYTFHHCCFFSEFIAQNDCDHSYATLMAGVSPTPTMSGTGISSPLTSEPQCSRSTSLTFS